jgi:hypothetical protein
MAKATEVPVTDTQPPYLVTAQERVDEIRAMREKIPNFVIPSSKGERQRLTTAASVPPQFVEQVAMTIKNSEKLVAAGAADADRIRDLMNYAEAYDSVADELEAMAGFVRHSVTVAKNTAGSYALTTYALAQRLAKRPETAELAPSVAKMKSALGKKGRKAKVQPAPAPGTPAPAPAPVTPPSSTK